MAVCGIIVGIHFGIEGQTRQKEEDHRAGDAPIIAAGHVAAHIGQEGQDLTQLFIDKSIDFRTTRGTHIFQARFGFRHHGNSTEEIEQFEIKERTHCTHFGAVASIVGVTE